MSDVTSVVAYAPGDIRCAFCEHANPPGARYCNACAADLQLTLCAQCDAINNRSQALCHKCGAALTAEQHPDAEHGVARMDAPAPPSPRPSAAFVVLVIALASGITAAWLVATQTPDAVPAQLRAAVSTLWRGLDQNDEPQSTSANAAGALPSASRTHDPGAHPDAGANASPGAPPTATVNRQDSPAAAGDHEKAAEPVANAQQPPQTEPSRTCTAAVAALSLCDRAK